MGRPERNDQAETHTATVTAYGQTWTPPPMASAAPEDFLPAWEVHLGGRTGLPYLETIEKLEGVLE